MAVTPPFSRRISGSQWVQNDFPESARIALFHLLYNLVRQHYVNDWISLDLELRRIARLKPIDYYAVNDLSAPEVAESSAMDLLNNLTWDKAFDFCERLYSHLAEEATSYNGLTDNQELKPREEVQRYIAEELQRIFLEENLAYCFDNGKIERRGRGHTLKQISKAEATLGDPRLSDARMHYKKALSYFNNYLNPDFENTVKEAVCAVEAAARRLFPQVRANKLPEVIRKIQGPRTGQIPNPLVKTIEGLYAYRNSGDGVSHGGTDGGKATSNIAEYAISIAASQIIFLHTLASEAEAEADIPF